LVLNYCKKRIFFDEKKRYQQCGHVREKGPGDPKTSVPSCETENKEKN
jgi:hypothetical protein